MIFTATDGEYSVELNPIDLKVFKPGPPEPFNWLLLILPFILGLLVFAAYREIRYRYTIEEVFLVDNAGVLLVHLSRGESKAIDAKLVSGMLTADNDLISWELSPFNPILTPEPGEGNNNSDIDLFEMDGRTYVYYATGDQATWGNVRVAEFDGGLRQFFESYFPVGAPMIKVSAKQERK